MRTRVERNAKQTIIATPSVRAIFTMVHRKSSRCSRNGLEVSVSGGSRNLKMSRSVIGPEAQRGASARGERGANAKRVSVANFIRRDHVMDFLAGEPAAIENRFAFISVRAFCTRLNRTEQKEVAALICKAGRREEIA